LVIWLPDSVARVSTKPIWEPPGAGPRLQNLMDVNPFNSDDGMRLMAQALVLLKP
jgi:hypothetical protein